jgi:Domain of unknown function (DUF4293)
MIQRIQTIFLAVVLALGIALFFVPFVRYDLPGGPLTVDLMPGATLHPLSSIYLLPVILNIISIGFTLYVIFRYKNRVLQMKLANLLMAFNTILLGVLLVFDFAELPATNGVPAKKYLLGAFFPIFSIIFSFLASYFIKKDEELVRSADRLR